MTQPSDSEKGILHPQEQARHRTLQRLAPGAAVARFVEWYWIVEWELDEPYTAEVLPYPSVNVTFEQPGGAFVNGVCTRKFERQLIGRGRVFGAKFWAGGFGAITGLDVGALSDQVVPLTDVFPDGDRLADLVFAEESDVRRRAVFEAFLHDHLAAPDPSYELVRTIVTAMATDRSLARVDEITARFDIPIRTLQRLFRRYVGVGPKWVLQRYRLHDGAELLARGEVAELADLSASLGYFDQAHFSKEFKQQIGLTPAEYAARTATERQTTYR
ncbi:AraC family transcriptional regulator [Kribbella sandramycini]|uniref:AraC family transcriptional regulator n=1 Tax=Kribbella sandramycini TaxID=60450 RepID=A0A7Y4P0S7_9ACTN|nr:helix-turn-helix domain-containing protein [Kribbella sandramycini]MBB6565166.1 AraC-like DNA-binding protein [Kribbella sandramycini]NOL41435.1 AraC family transcriptional regulator [Kribbella sandramycini]